ncbi:MAG: OmpA family protein [Proteobacteria bacterium]|nr:OmpA family protein [Pseudomonadota bacterium]
MFRSVFAMPRALRAAALLLLMFTVAGCETPEPPPPPPPPNVHHKEMTGVFFEVGSAVPTVNSIKILDAEMSSDYLARLSVRPDRTNKICIEARTDTVGSAAENLRLSQRRAEWVAGYLVKTGVDKSRLVIRSLGMAQPIVLTPPNTPEPQNRSVLVWWFNCR